MSDNEPKNDDQKIPPKLVIRPQPGAEPMADAASAAPDKKRETSRLSLDNAVENEGPVTPKTIRLKPATGAGKVPKPGIITQSPAVKADPVPEKRKTSRISLEAALAPEAPEGDAPKTIRLKKPSEAATVRVGQSAPAKTQTSAVSDTSALSKTSEIAAPDAGPVTKRKTIRVKRPTGTRGVDVSEKSQAEAPEAAPVAQPIAGLAPEPVVQQDEPNWFFVFSAVAAVLVCCVVIYMFTSQAFGPNSSLTRLSYGAPELDLAWPGKVTGSSR